MKKLLMGLMFLLMVTLNITAEVPPMIPRTFIQDHSQILNDEDRLIVEQRLRQFKTKYDCEFAVAIVNSLDGIPIENYSLEMARSYGIGSKDNEQRGILLLISLSDLRYRFEISRHMEPFLTDSQAGTIGRDVLIPRAKIASKVDGSLKSVSWRNTILSTLDSTDKVIARRYEPEVKQTPPVAPNASSDPTVAIVLLIVIGVMTIVFMIVFGRRL